MSPCTTALQPPPTASPGHNKNCRPAAYLVVRTEHTEDGGHCVVCVRLRRCVPLLPGVRDVEALVPFFWSCGLSVGAAVFCSATLVLRSLAPAIHSHNRPPTHRSTHPLALSKPSDQRCSRRRFVDHLLCKSKTHRSASQTRVCQCPAN